MLIPIVVLLAGLVAAAPAAARPPRPESCPPDRYVVRGGMPVVATEESSVGRLLTIAAGRASIEGVCEATKVRRRSTRKGTVFTARWRRCGTQRRVVLHAVLPRGGACEQIAGTLRARGVAAVPFEGLRSRCGDGFIDAGYGEHCEATAQCATGFVCLACECVPPVVTPTSSTTTTTYVPAQSSVCGNGLREPGEACDGTDLSGFVCPEGGSAACHPGCVAVDERACFRCGNGINEGDEECDLPDVGRTVCDQPGETGGFVGCTVGGAGAGGCRYDRTTCWRCGNARLEGDEECDDGGVLSGDGCSDACLNECGDGTVQAVAEECDDGNRLDGDGCASSCLD